MRINDYFDKVILINLDRREDRLEKLSTQLNNLGITFERFSAIDGKELGISPITAGTMSHQKVLEANFEKRILVLEDDALFADDFNENIFGNAPILALDISIPTPTFLSPIV